MTDQDTLEYADTQALAPRPPRYLRHSAPSIFRGHWGQRRRASSPGSAQTLIAPRKNKGPLGLNLLHEPSDTRIDFIFIHGIQGDSKKTWCFDSSDPSTFWPKEWLPFEPGFKHVRTHSFGYEADWTGLGSSSLTVHDFAQDLLAQMANSPSLKKNDNTPIVFVAHSMGGLVAKKAYLLGTRDPLYEGTVKRVHSFYFLGTPHRGSDPAIYMNYYLSFSPSQKEFPKELLPNSATVRSINDEFRHVQNVEIWSFFESVPTTAGHYIVTKDSATIGLPREHVQNLNANHRQLCKFENPSNRNYQTLYNSFKTTIEDIEREFTTRQTEKHKSQMRQIAAYLDIAERPSKDLLTELEKKHRGSCEWLVHDEHFQEWLDFEISDDSSDIGPYDDAPSAHQHRFFWLNGPPGSGKSVAAGHVINYLESHNVDCSYFFFKSNAKATVTQLLLSLAFQMAYSNFEIRQAFISMIENGDGANIQDHTVIWNNIYLGRIFKTQFSKPQFWIIDALDECPSKSLSAFIQMFAKVDDRVPFRIFATSRPNTHVDRLLKQEKVRYVEAHTGHDGSMNDIAAYIRSRPKLADIDDDDGEIVSEIVKKSKGVFLWASLIVDRLDDLYSVEDMRAELRKIPPEMNAMYTRILGEVEDSPSAGLAKCIMKWVVCAPEPLTTEVIKEAVRLDIGRTILASESDKVFSQICKNLITVDDESRVQVMHQTVKEFLCSAESDFYIKPRQAHERIATVCLNHLNDRRSDPRAPTRAPTRAVVPANLGGVLFDEHVDAHFSYHLAHSHAITPELFTLLVKFVDSTILTWVERIARTKKLSPLVKTVQNLKPYISRQLERSPPFDRNYQKVTEWVHEITRLVTVFGPYLVELPSSIRTLIPPLCPTTTILHRTFAGKCKPRVVCNLNQTWDERLSCLLLSATAKSLACHPAYLAVGLGNGNISVFNNSTLEPITTLHHGHRAIQKLVFGNISSVLVSCNVRELALWKLPNKQVWTAQLPQESKTICFSADDAKIYVAVKGNMNEAILTFDAADGRQIQPLPLTQNSSDSDEQPGDWRGSRRRYIPYLVRISPVLGLVAVAYRSSHLVLYSLDHEDNLEKLCRFKKEGYDYADCPTQIQDIAFNPAVESNLMAISYQDGDIVTAEVDGYYATQRDSINIWAPALASSPDGRTLAAGDNEGGVYLLTFDTLRVIRRIKALDDVAVGIVFASNSLRFYDIRANNCNVWEPPELIRKSNVDDSSSDPDEAAGSLTISVDKNYTPPWNDTKDITVMTPTEDGRFMFCGREDGSVTVHDTTSGKQVFEAQLHPVDLEHLEWQDKEKVLLSIDISGRCIGTQLSFSPWRQVAQKIDFRVSKADSGTVENALLKPYGLAVLISTQTGVELWEDGTVTRHSYSSGTDRWMLHPTDAERLLLFKSDKVHLFKWSQLERETQDSGISLSLPSEMIDLSLANEWCYRFGFDTLVQAIRVQSSTGFIRLSASDIKPSATTAIRLSRSVKRLLANVRQILAIHKSGSRTSIYFLSTRGWICSIVLDNLDSADPKTNYYTRHFFIPPLWRTGGEPMIRMLPGKQTVAIAYRDDLVLFQRFLHMEDKVEIGEAQVGSVG